MRFRLRTLLIVLAILPPLLAVSWLKYLEWRAERDQQVAMERELQSLGTAQQLERNRFLPVYQMPSPDEN